MQDRRNNSQTFDNNFIDFKSILAGNQSCKNAEVEALGAQMILSSSK